MMSDMIYQKKRERWIQTSEPCPNSNCKGLLLQSNVSHYKKCPVCGKKWIITYSYEEV